MNRILEKIFQVGLRLLADFLDHRAGLSYEYAFLARPFDDYIVGGFETAVPQFA
jgi:hypothetical protein